jgi:hypothetical protein
MTAVQADHGEMFQAAVQNNINLALPKQNKKRQNDTNI